MRYIKVLLLVLIFFVSMVFFFQNKEILSQEMAFKLHFFFTDPMKSMALPLYFVMLLAFLVGALVCFLLLIWDKMQLSARHMKANWRLKSLEKEVAKLRAEHEEHVRLDTPGLGGQAALPEGEAPRAEAATAADAKAEAAKA